jgi:hypothetical protein
MNRARFKRCKVGDLPGDVPMRVKIAMLEGRVPIQVFPWQVMTEAAAKSYRKDHHRKANKKFRLSARSECEQV